MSTNVDSALEACVESQIERWSQKLKFLNWLRRYQPFFIINFLFQYNILPTFGYPHSCAQVCELLYFVLKSSQINELSKKKWRLIRPRGLLHWQKKRLNSRTFFLVKKFGFIILFSFFFFFFTLNELIWWILRIKKVRSPGWWAEGGGVHSLILPRRVCASWLLFLGSRDPFLESPG